MGIVQGYFIHITHIRLHLGIIKASFASALSFLVCLNLRSHICWRFGKTFRASLTFLLSTFAIFELKSIYMLAFRQNFTSKLDVLLSTFAIFARFKIIG